METDLKIENPPIKNIILDRFSKLEGLINLFYENINKRVDKSNIFVYSNYTSPYSKRDYYKEFLGLHVLTVLKDRAIDYLGQ